jgi:hypothetical protein
MKSNKQRRAEIRAHRLARAARLEAELRKLDPRHAPLPRTPGLEVADQALLARLNPGCLGGLPSFYLDRAFVCRRCGAQCMWTARQQKWWYEIAQGRPDSRATHCLPCRRTKRAAHAAVMAISGANLLGELSQRLRDLAEAPPTAAARTEVESALASKWWGLRELAIAAMGRWASEQDVQSLRLLIEEGRDSKHHSWERTAAYAAIRALTPHLRHPDDDAWVMRLCLQGTASPWTWHAFLSALPAPHAEALILATPASQPSRLHAIRAALKYRSTQEQ